MKRHAKFTHYNTGSPIDPIVVWETAILNFMWANYSERYRLYPAEADEMARCHSITNVLQCDYDND